MTKQEWLLVKEMVAKYGGQPPMLDVGGVLNTTMADYSDGYQGVFSVPGKIWDEIDPNCDVTHDVEHHRGEYALVVSTSTLEHCRNPFEFVYAAERLLTRTGLLVLVTVFKWPIHGDIEDDQWRFTDQGLVTLCKPWFEIHEHGMIDLDDQRTHSYIVATPL
jgi:hypothetical protein